jgi:hypothetical protein
MIFIFHFLNFKIFNNYYFINYFYFFDLLIKKIKSFILIIIIKLIFIYLYLNLESQSNQHLHFFNGSFGFYVLKINYYKYFLNLFVAKLKKTIYSKKIC